MIPVNSYMVKHCFIENLLDFLILNRYTKNTGYADILHPHD